MKKVPRFDQYLATALIAALAGCGGGSGSNDNTAALAAAAVAAAAAAAGGTGGTGDGSPPKPTFVERCAQLVGKEVAIGSITTTKLLDASGEQPQTCQAFGQIVSSPTSTILFRVDLPEDSSWNSKFIQIGGGGYNGVINPVELIDLVAEGGVRKRGYAFVASDSGHQDPKGGFNFALNNPTALDNFAFNSHPQVLKVALATIQAVYGAAPTKKYFVGISTGGREALLQAQRYADSYDGIVAGMPVVDYSIVNQKGIAIAQAAFANGGAGWLNPAKVKLFETKQLAACDALDGLEDGLISDPQACNFDAQQLRCAAGSDTGDTCLSDPQIATVHLMRSRTTLPAPVANGITTAAALGVGNEASGTGWTTMQLGGSATSPASAEFNFADGYLKYGVTSSATTDLLSYTPGTYASQWLELSNKVNATNPDLGSFSAKGSKLILFHGTSDHLVPPEYSVDYYASVVNKLGQSKVDSFMRLYLVAGVGHTNVGNVLNALPALEDWVEKGQAPETLVNAKVAADNKTVAFTRPMCRYPAWAQYKGSGDVNSAGSFFCSSAFSAQ